MTIPQERGALLYLRYAGRWGAQVVKGRLNLGAHVAGRHVGPGYGEKSDYEEVLDSVPVTYKLFNLQYTVLYRWAVTDKVE
ncbi:hypothetical protein EVAR_74520_1 [Eumeta japonica]|uniref:Uncharacterized protein n=1 Tax=Eumeta variegata TaxID=151549 RepID=A0A4C1TCQ2_EUMVA|nr:hypothetical protein EVAR_74520_1 [Eumeta japonica]